MSDPLDDDPFGTAVASLRELQDLVAGSRPSDDALRGAVDRMTEAGALLRPWIVEEGQATIEGRHDLPGRGNPLFPAFVLDAESVDQVTGRVRFARVHLGGNGAAHGGTLPLLFDEVLGRLSNARGGVRARTAFLHVNYRKITPIGPELTIEGRLVREEGRKRYLTGRLLFDGDVLADAEGLFVALLPGQP